MTDSDLRVRNHTYARFVALGRAPRVEEVARELELSVDETQAAWRRLHRAHALVLEGDGGRLRMLNPFSMIPTPHRVHARGRWWYANCAWDAFGICAALHVDGTIHATCQDCGDPLRVEVADERPDDESLVFHCLVPATHWWDDIVFT